MENHTFSIHVSTTFGIFHNVSEYLMIDHGMPWNTMTQKSFNNQIFSCCIMIHTKMQITIWSRWYSTFSVSKNVGCQISRSWEIILKSMWIWYLYPRRHFWGSGGYWGRTLSPSCNELWVPQEICSSPCTVWLLCQ